jgi:hypothetical protein
MEENFKKIGRVPQKKWKLTSKEMNGRQTKTIKWKMNQSILSWECLDNG